MQWYQIAGLIFLGLWLVLCIYLLVKLICRERLIKAVREELIKAVVLSRLEGRDLPRYVYQFEGLEVIELEDRYVEMTTLSEFHKNPNIRMKTRMKVRRRR